MIGQITLRLTPGDGDLDLFVLGANADGTCKPASCLAASQQAGTALETITIPVVAGQSYYVVVDGYDGVEPSYSLELTCQKL